MRKWCSKKSRRELRREAKLVIHYLKSNISRCLNAVKVILLQSNMFRSLTEIHADFDIIGPRISLECCQWLAWNESLLYARLLYTRDYLTPGTGRLIKPAAIKNDVISCLNPHMYIMIIDIINNGSTPCYCSNDETATPFGFSLYDF